ncbi:hypothetical protein BKA64DRAFT_30370 [Cadophora sp. MPI-SDFR-AT-0126]|nr:hypothetical protein BKA64DRAFT_30370 [Leotiomycetes sp. MPI-SDFR-AT-0126]
MVASLRLFVIHPLQTAPSDSADGMQHTHFSCTCHRQIPGNNHSSGLRRVMGGRDGNAPKLMRRAEDSEGKRGGRMHVLAAEYRPVLFYLSRHVCTAWTGQAFWLSRRERGCLKRERCTAWPDVRTVSTQVRQVLQQREDG